MCRLAQRKGLTRAFGPLIFAPESSSPLAAAKCLTSGRVKMPHLAVAGRRMITRFDSLWQGAQRIL
jgi:hypothetical protein